MDELKPACHDCLSGDVAVKLIDQFGFEYYFCAPVRCRLAGVPQAVLGDDRRCG